MKMPWLPAIVTGSVVTAILVGTWTIDRLETDRQLYAQQSRLVADLTTLQVQLQWALHARAKLGHSLATYITTRTQTPEADLKVFVQSIVARDPAVYSIHILQGSQLKYRYPIDPAAAWHPVSSTESRPCWQQADADWDTWEPELNSGTRFCGLQKVGGDRLLLVSTTPVYRTALDNQPAMEVQIAINLDQLIQSLVTQQARIRSAARVAVSVQDHQLERRYGYVSLAADPVRLKLALGASDWELLAAPKGGWLANSWRSSLIWAAGLMIAAIGGIRAYRYSQASRQLAHAAQVSEDRWQLTLEGNYDGIWDWDPETDAVYYSPRWFGILGYKPAELDDLIQTGELTYSAAEWSSRLHPDDAQRTTTLLQNYLNRTTDDYQAEYRLRCRNGDYRWMLARGQAQWDATGRPTRMVGSLADIDDRKRAEAALRESEERFRAIVEQAAIGICQIDRTGRYLHVNQRFCNLLGYDESEVLNYSFQDLTYPEDLAHNLQQSQRLWQGEISSFSLEKRYIRKDGQLQWVNVTVSLVQFASDAQPYTLALVEDISARKQAEEQLTYSAFYDPLTGLPNRNLFVDRLKVCLSQAQRHPQRVFAVLYVDLDRFKVVNDSLGHPAGDELLVQIGQRFQGCLRCNDTVARLGGDEFAVILDEIHTSHEALWIADRVQDDLKQPFRIYGHDFYTSASIGVALSQDPTTQQPYANWQALMRDADIAMYRAKANGKGCSQLFEPTMHHSTLNQLQIESDLRHALATDALTVYFQPIVRLQDTRLVGFEALVRWQHPKQGWISPAVMVAAAEETDLIVHLGEWVLAAACAQLQQWRSRHNWPPGQPLSISVNLAGRQFAQTNLVQQIERTLVETGLPPACLRIEVTESAIAEQIDSVVDKLSRLKALGVQSCIDDFGTGYSSLSRLQQFPIDALKVDRSFVQDLPNCEDSAAIVRTIVNLARNLNIRTVAEGIETPDQLQCLKHLGCDYGQGFLFAKPMAAEAAERLLLGDRVLFSA